MKHTALLRRLIALIPLVLYFSPGLTYSGVQAASTLTSYYDFETTLSPWWGGSDSGTSSSFIRSTRNNQCPGNGSAAAELTISNTVQYPGGAWMWSSYSSAITSSVVITWSEISALACAGCTPIGYIGTTIPTSSSQFKKLAPSLTGSWQSYSLQGKAMSDPVYVAIGFLDTSITLVYPKAVDIDCVYVTIFP